VVSALFRSASSTAFDKLYRRHAAAVYRYARAVLGNHADAEDVTQQTFLNAYRALAQGTKPRKAENWVFTIAHNEVRRHLRDTRATRFDVELDEELPGAEPERTEPSVSDVLRALQQLSPNQRSALVMREFEGRPYAEIAEVMGVSQGALETLVFRARRSLAEALEDGLTCAEAELAVSLRLDGRLSRREARRLKAHMRECRVCIGFERRQKHQRSLLKGLSVIPVPASLFVFRGESAAAAGGFAVGAAATGGSAGVVAKAAAVAAAVTVAGGVGYTAGADPVRAGEAKPPIAQRAASLPGAARVKAVVPARPVSRALPARMAPAATRKARARTSRPARVGQPAAVVTSPPASERANAKSDRTKVDRKSARVSEQPSRDRGASRSQKAKRLKAKPVPRQPKRRSAELPAKAKAKPREKAVERVRPEPASRQRPEEAERAPEVTPPVLPPGREKQPLEPTTPETERKTRS
jgi:RNA polymerase sigma-70 factor, ECF subfamily